MDLEARSLDPLAMLTADAKGREAKRLDKTISLAAAESEVHVACDSGPAAATAGRRNNTD